MERDAVREIVEQFRAKHEITQAQRRRLSEPFQYFDLGQNARNSQMRFQIPMDLRMFREIYETMIKSPHASKRLGKEWIPQNANAIRKRTDDDRWASREEIRVLDDVCTRFMTKKFFPDAFIRINMTVNMIRMYDTIAKEFHIPYKIVFKGGVMMRLLILEFLHDLHVSVRHEAIDYLSTKQSAVGVSDFDFEIIPDDGAQSETETYRQVMVNSMYLLWLRKYIEEGIILKGHTDASKYDTSHHLMNTAWDYAESEYELRDMLQKEVDSLPSDHQLSGIRVNHVHIVHPDRNPPKLEHRTRFERRAPSTRENLYIFKRRDGNGPHEEVHVVPAYEVLRTLGMSKRLNEYLSPSMGALYCTSNFHIGEHDKANHSLSLSANFHLSRMKHAFYMYYTTKDGKRRIDRLAGEVVDLSQSHYGELDARKMHLYKDIAHPWTLYPILEVPGQKIRSYTLPALLHDIQDVLHHGDDMPWSSRKISKRLVRYCIVLIMVTYSYSIPRSEKNNAIRCLISYLDDPNVIRREVMRKTSVFHVNDFAEHEHISLKTHYQSKRLSSCIVHYYDQMKKHMEALLNIMTKDEHGEMNLQHVIPLNAMFVGHSDQLISSEETRKVKCDFLHRMSS
jgi:hypothetical protein